MLAIERSKKEMSESQQPLPTSPFQDFEELEIEEDDGEIVHEIKSPVLFQDLMKKFDLKGIPLISDPQALVITATKDLKNDESVEKNSLIYSREKLLKHNLEMHQKIPQIPKLYFFQRHL
jgi:hypothetical protein